MIQLGYRGRNVDSIFHMACTGASPRSAGLASNMQRDQIAVATVNYLSQKILSTGSDSVTEDNADLLLIVEIESQDLHRQSLKHEAHPLIQQSACLANSARSSMGELCLVFLGSFWLLNVNVFLCGHVNASFITFFIAELTELLVVDHLAEAAYDLLPHHDVPLARLESGSKAGILIRFAWFRDWLRRENEGGREVSGVEVRELETAFVPSL